MDATDGTNRMVDLSRLGLIVDAAVRWAMDRLDSGEYALRCLAFVETERPLDAGGTAFRPFSRFVLDQDAGGAIRTSARVDLYLGSGAYAENAAGRMRQPGRLHYLLLR